MRVPSLDLIDVRPNGAVLKIGRRRVFLDEKALEKLYFLTSVALVEIEEVYHGNKGSVSTPSGELAPVARTGA